MSEQQGEKTENATPKKIQDARKKGQVGQSPDIPRLLICFAVFETIIALLDFGIGKLQYMIAQPIALLALPFDDALSKVLAVSFEALIILTITALIPALFMGILGSWLQFGILFAPEAVRIDFTRLNPVAAFKQMFGPEKFVELLTNTFKVFIITGICSIVIYSWLEDIFLLPRLDMVLMAEFFSTVFVSMSRICLLVLLLLSLFDFAMKKYFHLKQLKMTKDEVKREYKEQEGDPLVKRQRRNLALELSMEASRPSGKKVDQADVVVVNPTHYAVALYYRPDETPLPTVIVKGTDDKALDLIEQAHKHSVPVVRYIWLARTLYELDTGSFISRETLKPVAVIYKMIKEIDEAELRNEILHFPEDEM